jgi:UDP-N-acetylmuramoylalanine--D-glutamate ligase
VYARFVWLAGGQSKAGGIADLAPYFSRVETAFLIGRDAEAFAATLRAHGVPCTVAGTLEAAVPPALVAARGCGVLLFSPAAASFDQFADFEARGQRFTALVRAAA